MLKQIHFLLTYRCLYECDHCFLYCGPRFAGTFTIAQVEEAIRQGVEAGIDTVYVEGGEPLLYYPLALETLRIAKQHGLRRGLVTNCYWATSERDAELWLEPLAAIGLDDLAVSDDGFHSADSEHSPAKTAYRAAGRLGLPVGSICIEPSSALLKGRAVETLSADRTRRSFECFDACVDEELVHPSRVHIDPFGNVFPCQGLAIGNIWQKPLAQVMSEYDPARHPIIGPLIQGGPAELARRFGLPAGDSYASACHLCYLVRKSCLDDFPEYLCPRPVYGESATD